MPSVITNDKLVIRKPRPGLENSLLPDAVSWKSRDGGIIFILLLLHDTLCNIIHNNSQKKQSDTPNSTHESHSKNTAAEIAAMTVKS